jgi:hypothetical protein
MKKRTRDHFRKGTSSSTLSSSTSAASSLTVSHAAAHGSLDNRSTPSCSALRKLADAATSQDQPDDTNYKIRVISVDVNKKVFFDVVRPVLRCSLPSTVSSNLPGKSHANSHIYLPQGVYARNMIFIDTVQTPCDGNEFVRKFSFIPCLFPHFVQTDSLFTQKARDCLVETFPGVVNRDRWICENLLRSQNIISATLTDNLATRTHKESSYPLASPSLLLFDWSCIPVATHESSAVPPSHFFSDQMLKVSGKVYPTSLINCDQANWDNNTTLFIEMSLEKYIHNIRHSTTVSFDDTIQSSTYSFFSTPLCNKHSRAAVNFELFASLSGLPLFECIDLLHKLNDTGLDNISGGLQLICGPSESIQIV